VAAVGVGGEIVKSFMIPEVAVAAAAAEAASLPSIGKEGTPTCLQRRLPTPR